MVSPPGTRPRRPVLLMRCDAFATLQQIAQAGSPSLKEAHLHTEKNAMSEASRLDSRLDDQVHLSQFDD